MVEPPVEPGDQRVPHLRAGHALQQQRLRTEDLGRLREDRGAALAHDCVRHPADQRIGGDAGPAVAAAAFERQRQPGQGLRAAAAGVHLWEQPLNRRDPGLDRAAEAAFTLDGEPRDARRGQGDVADQGRARIGRRRLAAQPDEEDAADVGIDRQVGERTREIALPQAVRRQRATAVVDDRDDAVDVLEAGQPIRREMPGDPAGRVAHTVHR